MDIIMTIADNLQTLIDCKADMKSAIEERGVTVSGGLSTYADAIREIEAESTITYLPVGTKFGDTTFKFNHKYYEDIGSGMPSVTPTYVSDFEVEVKPLINPNETDMSYMFCDVVFDATNAFIAKDIIYMTSFDTSKVTDMSYMFCECVIPKIPQLDTSNVSNMSCMFRQVGQRGYEDYINVEISDLDCSSVIDITDLFVDSNNSYSSYASIVSMPAFINLGKEPDLIGADSRGFLAWRRLSHDEYIRIIDNLYDRKSAGYSIKNIRISSGTIENNLTDADIALATNKGWSIIS